MSQHLEIQCMLSTTTIVMYMCTILLHYSVSYKYNQLLATACIDIWVIVDHTVKTPMVMKYQV